MCFTVLDGSKRQQAKRNITVYKVLDRFRLKSPYNTFFWKKDVINTSRIGARVDNEINKGFHSLQSLVLAKEYKSQQWSRDGDYKDIYKFIIPKGAYYYKNHTQYVSSRLILKSEKPVT